MEVISTTTDGESEKFDGHRSEKRNQEKRCKGKKAVAIFPAISEGGGRHAPMELERKQRPHQRRAHQSPSQS